MAEPTYQLDDKRLLFTIDWDKPRDEFEHDIDVLLQLSVEHHKVIVLPLLEGSSGSMTHRIGLLALIAGAIDCSGCDARCCRQNPDGQPTNLAGGKEISRITRLMPGGAHPINYRHIDGQITAELPFPCCFLKDERCSIYHDRPFVCRLFPFQSNEISQLALSSDCPPAPALARRVYIEAYDIRRDLKERL